MKNLKSRFSVSRRKLCFLPSFCMCILNFLEKYSTPHVFIIFMKPFKCRSTHTLTALKQNYVIATMYASTCNQVIDVWHFYHLPGYLYFPIVVSVNIFYHFTVVIHRCFFSICRPWAIRL